MLGMIENPMALGWRPDMPQEVMEELNEEGYKEFVAGIFVPEEDAFNYALERCFEIVPEGIHGFKWTQEFKEMLVGWFYSGNWVHENGA